MYMNASIK